MHRGADAAGQLPPPLPRHPEAFDELVDDLRAGVLDAEVPPHGTLGRNRQQIPADRAVGARHPDDVTEGPAWIQVSPA